MTVQIGRTLVDCPYGLREFGDTLAFSFEVAAANETVDEVQARVHQLRGLATGEVVPAIFADDERLTGFYRVVDVQLEPVDTYLVNGFVRGVATITRSSPASHLIYGTLHQETNRSTATYAVSPLPRVFAPAEAVALTDWAQTFTRKVIGGADIAALTPASGSLSYRVPTDSFYDFGCSVEVLWPDNVWRPVTGVGLLPSWATPSRVRLSNNRYRWTLRDNGTSPSSLLVAGLLSGGVGWDAEVTAVSVIGFDGTSTNRHFGALPRVLLNSQAACVVEYPDDSVDGRTLTVRQQRGEGFVTITSQDATGMRLTFPDSVSSTGTGWALFGSTAFATETTFTASTTFADSTGGGTPSRSVMIGRTAGGSEDANSLARYWWAGVAVRDIWG